MTLLGEALQVWTLLAVPLAVAVLVSRRRKRVDQALCDAASSGDLARVRKMLADGVSENSADEDATTALMAAAFAGEVKVVGLLLDAGADPNLQDESGLTALMNAVIGDGEMDLEGAQPVFQEIIEMLLAAGADVSLEDENESTAADHAVSYGLDEVARLIDDGLPPGRR